MKQLAMSLGAIAWVLVAGNLTALAQHGPTERAAAFITKYETNVKPLETALGKAWWKANTTGSDEAFAEKEALENRYNELLSNAEDFAELKALRDAQLSDQQKRQIELLYLEYLDKQVDVALLNRMSAKSNEIEKAFNVFRATVGDKTFTDSEVREVLKQSKDSDERKGVWEAAKQVGSEVASDLRELVQLRNQAAKKLGFADFHVMQLEINEQKQADVLALFDELDELTREPFAQAKQEIDERLAEHYGIDVEELRPWHYHDPFSKSRKTCTERTSMRRFVGTDILQVCRDFYTGIGLPIEDVLLRSDLYEKPGKSHTRSAPTSIARATCVCWPTSSPTRIG